MGVSLQHRTAELGWGLMGSVIQVTDDCSNPVSIPATIRQRHALRTGEDHHSR